MTRECECDCVCTERAVVRIRASVARSGLMRYFPPWDAGTPWINTCVGCAIHVARELLEPLVGETP